MGWVMGLFVLSTVQAAPGHGYGHARGGFHPGPVRGPGAGFGYGRHASGYYYGHGGYVRPYAYPSYYRPYYGYWPSRFVYPYSFYRPFPYETPGIYVVPQKPRQAGDSSLPYDRIIHLSPSQEEDLIDRRQFPDHTLEPVPEEAMIKPGLPEGITSVNAWAQLDSEEDAAALVTFASLANQEQGRTDYKIGYGLAAAFNGDAITAAYALRQAVATDPNGVEVIPLTPKLKDRARALADYYLGKLKKDREASDLRFLFAFASHLAGEDAPAREALTKAEASGEVSVSTANLKRLVEASLLQSRAQP